MDGKSDEGGECVELSVMSSSNSEMRDYRWLKPERKLTRYVGLFFMCFMSFGCYFTYDAPAALEDRIIKDMDITLSEYTQLYSMYAWPNVILCFFGGFLVDRVFGIRFGAILFCAIITAGQLVVAVGAFFNMFWLMDVGRFIFGVGGESLIVAQNAYLVSWFKDKELNFVFGLQLSIARIGSFVGMNTMRPLYDRMSFLASGHTLIGIIMFMTAITCVFSFGSSLIVGFIDRLMSTNRNEVTNFEETAQVHIRDFLKFKQNYWYIVLICVFYYVCILPFVALGTIFIKRKYDMPNAEANGIDSMIHIISAFSCPLFGLLIDFTGHNLWWVMASAILTLFSHGMFAFTIGISPWIPMSMMGLGYSVFACAIWPIVSLIVPENLLGTAYGAMQSVQNLGLAVVPLIAGYIVDRFGFIYLELFFLAFLCLWLLYLGVIRPLMASGPHGDLPVSSSFVQTAGTSDETIVHLLQRIQHLEQEIDRLSSLEKRTFHSKDMDASFPVTNRLSFRDRLRILVTGGAGFVGSHLVDRLMMQGHEVTVVDNFFTGRRRNVEHWIGHARFELIRHDIVNPLMLEVDQIYHLASPASPPHYMFNPVKTIKTNFVGTMNMLGLAKRVGAKILVASTSEVYGDPEVHPQSESYWGRVNPIGPRSCYDEGKRSAEALSMAYSKQDKVDVRIARIFNTYGPRMLINDGRVVSNFIAQALMDKPLLVYGTGKQTRSFQFVSDLVDGLILLMASNVTGPVNLGNPDENTIEDFAHLIKGLVQSNSDIKNTDKVEDDPQRRKPDINRAIKELGWKPRVTLQQGLAQTVKYFQQELIHHEAKGPNNRNKDPLGSQLEDKYFILT